MHFSQAPMSATTTQILSDDLIEFIFEQVALTSGPKAWCRLPLVCKRWACIWKTIVKPRVVRWRHIALPHPATGNVRGDIGRMRYGGNLALVASGPVAAAPNLEGKGLSEVLSEDVLKLAHITRCDDIGRVYVMGYTSIHQVFPCTRTGWRARDISPSFSSGPLADMMCVGKTVFVSTVSGLVQARTNDGHIINIAQNQVDMVNNRQTISALSNHDPCAQYGAMLAYTNMAFGYGPLCVLWIVKDIELGNGGMQVACISVGIGYHAFKSVSISKTGKKVCVETRTEDGTDFYIYGVTYGDTVFDSEITTGIVIHHTPLSLPYAPCRDVVMTDTLVVAMESNGDCVAFNLLTGSIEWIFRAHMHGEIHVGALAVASRGGLKSRLGIRLNHCVTTIDI